MSRDDGWDDSELDAFELGDCDENGICRSGRTNDTHVTSASSDTPPIAPRHRFGPLSAHLTTMENEA